MIPVRRTNLWLVENPDRYDTRGTMPHCSIGSGEGSGLKHYFSAARVSCGGRVQGDVVSPSSRLRWSNATTARSDFRNYSTNPNMPNHPQVPISMHAGCWYPVHWAHGALLQRSRGILDISRQLCRFTSVFIRCIQAFGGETLSSRACPKCMSPASAERPVADMTDLSR